MNQYEKLLAFSESAGISVDENFPFKGELQGLYLSGNIALSDKLDTTAQKNCILAEELGHHFTSSGDILDPSLPENRKQEHLARVWAYNFLVGLHKLIDAYRAGCQNRYEIAEYLGITEEFLQELVTAYRSRYGVGICVDEYYVMFIPNLQIMKLDRKEAV